MLVRFGINSFENLHVVVIRDMTVSMHSCTLNSGVALE